MASAPGDASPRLMTALGNITASVLGMLETRLGLLANELQIQKQQLVRQLRLSLALLVCLVLVALLLVALVVVVWWEQRIFLLGFFVLQFAALSLYFFITLQRNNAQQPALFALSLAELQEDLRQLKQASSHEPPPS